MTVTSKFSVQAQTTSIVKWEEFAKLLKPGSDTTYVINFWATWCKPCVREIPYFNQLNSKFPGKKLRVILVSLDFKRQFETNLLPFIEKNKIQQQVLLLDEPDYNSWIDKVEPSWTGAIPATLVVNSMMRIRNFYEKEFTEQTLFDTIKPLIP